MAFGIINKVEASSGANSIARSAQLYKRAKIGDVICLWCRALEQIGVLMLFSFSVKLPERFCRDVVLGPFCRDAFLSCHTSMSLFESFTSPSKVLSAYLCLCLQVPSKSQDVPSTSFWCFVFFLISFSIGFLQISRSTKSKSYLFTSGGPCICSTKWGSKISKRKTFWNLMQQTFEGVRKISRPFKILIFRGRT